MYRHSQQGRTSVKMPQSEVFLKFAIKLPPWATCNPETEIRRRVCRKVLCRVSARHIRPHQASAVIQIIVWEFQLVKTSFTLARTANRAVHSVVWRPESALLCKGRGRIASRILSACRNRRLKGGWCVSESTVLT